MAAVRNLLIKNVHRRILGCCIQRHLSSRKDPYILDSGFPDVEMPRISIYEHVFENVHKWGNKIAAECGITGRKYTYDEIRRKSRNFNRALRKKLKLNKGDVIASLLPNTPEYPIVIFGTIRSGMILTTLNPLYTAGEISRQLIDSSAKVIVTLPELWKTTDAAVKLTKKHIPIITIKTKNSEATPPGAIDFSEITDNEFDIDDLPPPKPEDIAFMPYSSGTTGLPKGVELTHYNIVSNVVQCQHDSLSIFEETTDSHQDVVPVILPSFHIYGLTGINLQSMHCGSKLVTLPKFAPDSLISLLSIHRAHILYLAPPLVLFLTMHPDVKPEHLQSVRTVVNGAAPLGASDEKNFLDKVQLPISIIQGYGLTETSPMVSGTNKEVRKKYNYAGSIGTPVVNTLVKIAPAEDPTGSLGPNELGEIIVKGPQVMKGYHNKPEETEKVFVDGWLRTGDMGYFNENGILYITDRLKELIKVKGFQVPPAELEALLRSHPDVSDAAVIGIPHPFDGEVPRAYIVQKSGKSINTDKLYEFVSERVAQYKRLKGGICVVDAIPKNSAGKILRRQLKEEYIKQEQIN